MFNLHEYLLLLKILEAERKRLEKRKNDELSIMLERANFSMPRRTFWGAMKQLTSKMVRLVREACHVIKK